MFSCEYCEIFITPLMAASVKYIHIYIYIYINKEIQRNKLSCFLGSLNSSCLKVGAIIEQCIMTFQYIITPILRLCLCESPQLHSLLIRIFYITCVIRICRHQICRHHFEICKFSHRLHAHSTNSPTTGILI